MVVRSSALQAVPDVVVVNGKRDLWVEYAPEHVVVVHAPAQRRPNAQSLVTAYGVYEGCQVPCTMCASRRAWPGRPTLEQCGASAAAQAARCWPPRQGRSRSGYGMGLIQAVRTARTRICFKRPARTRPFPMPCLQGAQLPPDKFLQDGNKVWNSSSFSPRPREGPRRVCQGRPGGTAVGGGA